LGIFFFFKLNYSLTKKNVTNFFYIIYINIYVKLFKNLQGR